MGIKENAIRLSELTKEIKLTLDLQFSYQTFWVIAEITNHQSRGPQHFHYFDLVEKDPSSDNLLSKVSGRAWKQGAERIAHFEEVTGQKFTDNISILIKVSVAYHALYGLSLELLDIDTSYTLGLLEKQKRETLHLLEIRNPEFIRREGDVYFTKNMELELPIAIKRIAVISSSKSAGLEDFHHTLKFNNRAYIFEVDDFNTSVQGVTNSGEILQTLIKVYYQHKICPYDVVVITRGGGAQTDLLIFDDYNLARAIAKFPIPVIVGVGHEKNRTIADMMAKYSLRTPTKAAEFIIAHNRTFEESILLLQSKISSMASARLDEHRELLDKFSNRLINASKDQVRNKNAEVLELKARLHHGLKMLLQKLKNSMMQQCRKFEMNSVLLFRDRLNQLRRYQDKLGTFCFNYLKLNYSELKKYTSLIKLASPESVLKRGFAYIKKGDKIITSPQNLEKGCDISVILNGVAIISTVKSKNKYNGKDFDL